MKRKRIITIIIIIAIIIGSILLYYFSIIPPALPSPYVREFSTTKTGSYPNAIAVDGQGRVWFALENETAIGMLYPSNGTIKTYQLPEPKTTGIETWGIVADNSNELIYFTDHISNAIWSFNPASLNFTKFTIPTSDAFPFQIALGPQGNIWFTESFGAKLGELNPSSGAIQEYAVPGNNSEQDPTGLVISNGTIWFTEPDSNMIGSFSDGKFTMYNTTGYIYSPVGIAIDKNGNVWVTQHTYPGLISEFSPKTHAVKTFSTSFSPAFGTSLPYFIYTDSDGNLWFNEHYANSIAVFNPASNTLIEYYVPLKFPIQGNLSYILTMTLSASGEPWFTELFTGNIGTINYNVAIKQNVSMGTTVSASVSNGSSISVPLSISGGGTLSAYVGNFTGGFGFSFTPRSGEGNYTSTLTIENKGSGAGVYFVTVSDATRFLTVSKVIEITVP